VRVLLVHNRYRTSAPSGEDQARRQTNGACWRPTAWKYRPSIAATTISMSRPGRQKGALAVNTIWSRRSRLELQARLRSVRPDIVHVHNTFAMISPSIYGACRAEGVPVVQTLHNFRFFCPGGLFLRDGKPCEDCVDH